MGDRVGGYSSSSYRSSSGSSGSSSRSESKAASTTAASAAANAKRRGDEGDLRPTYMSLIHVLTFPPLLPPSLYEKEGYSVPLKLSSRLRS